MDVFRGGLHVISCGADVFGGRRVPWVAVEMSRVAAGYLKWQCTFLESAVVTVVTPALMSGRPMFGSSVASPLQSCEEWLISLLVVARSCSVGDFLWCCLLDTWIQARCVGPCYCYCCYCYSYCYCYCLESGLRHL